MKKIMIFLLISSCTGIGINTAGASGIGYSHSFYTASHAPLFVECRDLTDEEIDDADNLPGGGYNDGKWTGENPPTEEDEDGNPTYSSCLTAQHVWEDDDGNIFILEDDGEITEVST